MTDVRSVLNLGWIAQHGIGLVLSDTTFSKVKGKYQSDKLAINFDVVQGNDNVMDGALLNPNPKEAIETLGLICLYNIVAKTF